MDVGAFSDEKFDAKDWINKSFKSPEALDNKDTFVSSVVMKLQLYVQQVNNAMEDSCEQVLQNMPRIKRDAEVLQQEVLLLKDKMDTLKIDIAKIESDTGNSMATLEHIDRIKTSLQVAKQALHEADNWSVLANDLEEVFESHQVDLISKKIVAMQQSLAILANVPDYEDRKLQLEGLKNRLEAMTSPKLVQAFTSGSIEQAKYYVKIFTEVDRMPQLLKYYHKCQKGLLLQQWNHCIESDQEDGVLDCMKRFYDILLSKWNDQVKWSVQVLAGTSHSVDSLLELHRDVLISLEPSFTSCLDDKLKQQGVEPLKLLGDAKLATSRFANNFKTALQTSKTNFGKTYSKEKVLRLGETIYEPYVGYIKRYESYEEHILLSQMSVLIKNQSANVTDLMDAVHTLGGSISRTIQALLDANKRCLSFSEGCAYPALFNAFKTFFTKYLDHWRILQRKIDQQKREHEDWHLFQISLTYLQYMGELINEMRQLDLDLIKSLLEISRRLNEAENLDDPFIQYRLLLLTPEDRRKLENLLAEIQDDSCILESSISTVARLCSDLHHSLYLLLLAPVYRQLEQVQSAPGWQPSPTSKPAIASDLPDFSYTPHEYITQIGQYLMTLPQHLEPFLLQENPSLTAALQAADSAYGNTQQAAGADVLLSIVAKGTCQAYLDHVLGIYELPSSSCKQLATDIDYLGNVLDDLGLSLSEHLKNVSTLLRLPSDQYHSRSAGCAPRLVAAVRQMRNITSI